MESWYFDQEEDKLNVVVDGSKRGEVKGIDTAKKVGFVRDETFKVNDQVEAFWRFDTGEEQWLTANVVTVYADGKMIKVKYLSDDSIAKVPKSWVRGF